MSNQYNFSQPGYTPRPRTQGGFPAAERRTQHVVQQQGQKKKQGSMQARPRKKTGGGWVSDLLNTIIEFMGDFLMLMIVIGGYVVLNVADLAGGTITTSQIYTNAVDVGFFTLGTGTLAFGVSLATSFIQFVFWRIVIVVLRGASWKKMTRFQQVAVCASLLLGISVMIFDTTLDMAATNWLIGGISPLAYNFWGGSWIRKSLDILFAIICAGNEVFTSMIGIIVKGVVDDDWQWRAE